MMQASSLIAVLISFGLPAHAGFLDVPYEVWCVKPLVNDRPFSADGAMVYTLDADVFEAPRVKQMEEIRTEYVAPAMRNACKVRAGIDTRFASSAATACAQGCEEVNSSKSKPESDVKARVSVCKADCSVGNAVLLGMAIGYGYR